MFTYTGNVPRFQPHILQYRIPHLWSSFYRTCFSATDLNVHDTKQRLSHPRSLCRFLLSQISVGHFERCFCPPRAILRYGIFLIHDRSDERRLSHLSESEQLSIRHSIHVHDSGPWERDNLSIPTSDLCQCVSKEEKNQNIRDMALVILHMTAMRKTEFNKILFLRNTKKNFNIFLEFQKPHIHVSGYCGCINRPRAYLGEPHISRLLHNPPHDIPRLCPHLCPLCWICPK
jgi:hypothetical protein